MKETISINEQYCYRCTHSWWPRLPEKPKKCPKCKSPYYADKEPPLKGPRPKEK